MFREQYNFTFAQGFAPGTSLNVSWKNGRSTTSNPIASYEPAFVADVARTLSQTGMPAHALCLEITESVLMQDSSATAETITKLREHGIRIALDDFGTGYSSLSYLRRFSLDMLKIDRSFVTGLDQCIEDRVIVAAIITMAHALGLDVTAEGIETPEQLQTLRELGCAYAQGYLLARPMPAKHIQTLLNNLQTPSTDGSRADGY